VEADNGKKSTDEGAAGLSFSLMTAAEARPVQQAVASLTALNLSEEAQALALAQLYQGDNLVADAIETLTGEVDKGTQVAAIYRMLGDIYLQSGVNLSAESSYQQAITLAQSNNDIEGQAIAEYGLGEVEAALGKKANAISVFNQSLGNYTQLGDQKNIDQINARLGELQ